MTTIDTNTSIEIRPGKTKLLERDIEELARAYVTGSRTRGSILAEDVEAFAAIFERITDLSEVRSVKLYSQTGFVANSYRGRPLIGFLLAEAHPSKEGVFLVQKGTDGANRSKNLEPSFEVINGRYTVDAWLEKAPKKEDARPDPDPEVAKIIDEAIFDKDAAAPVADVVLAEDAKPKKRSAPKKKATEKVETPDASA